MTKSNLLTVELLMALFDAMLEAGLDAGTINMVFHSLIQNSR